RFKPVFVRDRQLGIGSVKGRFGDAFVGRIRKLWVELANALAGLQRAQFPSRSRSRARCSISGKVVDAFRTRVGMPPFCGIWWASPCRNANTKAIAYAA
ncbi:MAG: hypothetical protein ABIZ82_09545, partial [Candidatus Tumulicola sp.]